MRVVHSRPTGFQSCFVADHRTHVIDPKKGLSGIQVPTGLVKITEGVKKRFNTMHIVTSRERLLPALNQVGGVVERRQTLPILGNLLVSARAHETAVTATDLEVQIKSQFEAGVREEGDVTLPARKLIEICKALPEGSEISINVERSRAGVVAGRSRFALATLPAGDYPLMEVPDDYEAVKVPATVLRGMLEKSAFAMAQQDVRYYLNGLFLKFTQEGLTAVATDGHRMAKIEETMSVDVEDDREIILPRKTVIELNRLVYGRDEEVVLEVSDKAVRVGVGDSVLTSKLVDGRYPEYERVIPLMANKVAIVDRESLRQALLRAAILSNEKYKGVNLTFRGNELRVQAHNPEQEEAEEELVAVYEEEETSMGFNVAYLLDVLNILDNDDVEVRFSDSNSSALIRNQGLDKQSFVVMPMRL
jgi:DNA polymerase-3 subunit beta